MSHIEYLYKPTKYRLNAEYKEFTGITGYEAETPLIKLTKDGELTVRYGYGFDPSGPTIDTPSAIRGSCEHDAFYELMRLRLIPISELDRINDRLEYVCKEDGMFELRAEMWDFFLDAVGKKSVEDEIEILIAPREYDIDEIDENQLG